MQIFPWQNNTGDTSDGLIRNLDWEPKVASHFELVLRNANEKLSLLEVLSLALSSSGLSVRKHLALANEIFFAIKPTNTDDAMVRAKEVELLKEMLAEGFLIHPNWAKAIRYLLCGNANAEVQQVYDEYQAYFGIEGIQTMVVHLGLIAQPMYCAFAARNEFDIYKMRKEVNG